MGTQEYPLVYCAPGNNSKGQGDSKGRVCVVDILHGAYRGISINAMEIWSISVNVPKIWTTQPKSLKLSKLNCYHLKLISVKNKLNPCTFIEAVGTFVGSIHFGSPCISQIRTTRPGELIM